MSSDTPMADLYTGIYVLSFASSSRSKVYHGWTYNPKPDLYCTQCERDCQVQAPRGAVTTEKEQDIAAVRRPCKLCLAALHKAQKEAAK